MFSLKLCVNQWAGARGLMPNTPGIDSLIAPDLCVTGLMMGLPTWFRSIRPRSLSSEPTSLFWSTRVKVKRVGVIVGDNQVMALGLDDREVRASAGRRIALCASGLQAHHRNDSDSQQAGCEQQRRSAYSSSVHAENPL